MHLPRTFRVGLYAASSLVLAAQSPIRKVDRWPEATTLSPAMALVEADLRYGFDIDVRGWELEVAVEPMGPPGSHHRESVPHAPSTQVQCVSMSIWRKEKLARGLEPRTC